LVPLALLAPRALEELAVWVQQEILVLPGVLVLLGVPAAQDLPVQLVQQEQQEMPDPQALPETLVLMAPPDPQEQQVLQELQDQRVVQATREQTDRQEQRAVQETKDLPEVLVPLEVREV